jgi:hypothetical protein
MILLISGVAGSPLEDVPKRAVAALVSLALAHFRTVRPGFRPTRMQRANLELAYRSFMRATAEILARYTRERDVRAALGAYMQYHVAGLRGMFEACAARRGARMDD